ncbi:MAG: hypothetical protein JRH12_04815 [Deltaproteobacteria bacterium]|jgi:hypothetical protein|nr:hypothetical protein [Deltaproteobacteria bacterium]MBW2479930.1 hypothetical protein [Deltaproteobacteria bacterium]
MLKKYFLRIVGSVSIAVICACGSTAFHKPSTLDKNWGRSFESAKYNQILDHRAAKNQQPVVGLDGVASENSKDAYRRRFAVDASSPEYNINLNGIGGIGGDR